MGVTVRPTYRTWALIVFAAVLAAALTWMEARPVRPSVVDEPAPPAAPRAAPAPTSAPYDVEIELSPAASTTP